MVLLWKKNEIWNRNLEQSSLLIFGEKTKALLIDKSRNWIRLKLENNNPEHRCEANWNASVSCSAHNLFEQRETHSYVPP